MAAKIQAEKTPIKKAVITRRAMIIVLAVFIMHAAILITLATLTPAPLHRPEPPKPIAVRFVQVTPPKPLQQDKPKPAQPKVPPKKIPPKEVKVVKPQPKPVIKPKPAVKPKPVLSTTTTSTQKQQVVLPISTSEETKRKTEPKPETETQAKTKPETDSKADTQSKPESKSDTSSQQSTPAAPVLVEGVSYIKPPRLNITERDLKGEARTVKLRINIGANGKVDAVQVVSSSGITALDQKVANALKRATFTPHRINGVAVPVYTVQPFELNLPQ